MPSSAPGSRTRVHRVIADSAVPVTVEHIAEATGLHANTIRGHLDVLLATDEVTRELADSTGRGRPRWLYRASVAKASPFRALAEALSERLADVHDPAVANAAAARWAQALPELPVASSPDEAVAEASEALVRLGFDAVASPLGDTISVTSCPYADIVDDNPVICDIHTALVARLLAQTGQDVAIEAMDVWARSGMCVARLHRPDLKPSRTITADERGVITSSEGSTS